MRARAPMAAALLAAACAVFAVPAARAASPATPDEVERLLARRMDVRPSGAYAFDAQYTFNVLDAVHYDAATGQLSLIGHFDEHFRGPRIPYLHYLATLLEVERPEFSLAWTPESERRVAAFFDRSISKEEGARITDSWGTIFDESGRVTFMGRYLLPAMGVAAVEDGRTAGYMGVDPGPGEDGAVLIRRVADGSPAERAGLKAGDEIVAVESRRPFVPEELRRLVRRAGAGRALRVEYRRNGRAFATQVALAADPYADAWADVTRYDVMAYIHRAAGNARAAELIRVMGLSKALSGTPSEGAVLEEVLRQLGIAEETQRLAAAAREGRMSAAAAQAEVGRRFAGQMDSIFRFAGAPATRAYESAMAGGGNLSAGLAAASNALDEQLKIRFGAFYDGIFLDPGGFQVPPEVVEATFGVHPEMAPEFREVPAGSLLARLMFEADYLSKRLMNRRDLKRRIPRYQTEFEFARTHPGFNRSEATYRLWISVAAMDVAQSPDGRTLAYRRAAMRFNIRERKAGRDLPASPGGYEDLLTSLYDELALEYPALHELREAAKLAAAAAWIRARDPGVRLPQAGRGSWEPPAVVPGLVYIYLSPDPVKQTKVTLLSEGGISLVPFPQGAAPPRFSADVVDLRGNGEALITVPAPYRNDALSRVLGRHIEVPPWRPAGWAAQADRGTRALESISLLAKRLDRGNAEACVDAANGIATAHALALRLAQTERAAGILSRSGAERAHSFQELQDELLRDRAEFSKGVVKIMTLVGSGIRSAAKKEFDASEDQETLLNGFDAGEVHLEHGAEGRWRESFYALDKAMKKWAKTITRTSAAGEAIVDGASVPLEPWTIELKPIFEKVDDVKILLRTWAVEAAFAKLEFITDFRVQRLEDVQQTEARALQEKLLPLQRELSASLDRVLARARSDITACGAD